MSVEQLCRKGCGVSLDSTLAMSQQSILAAKVAKSIPGHTTGTTASRPKKTIIYFCSATCGIACPVWGPKKQGKSQQAKISGGSHQVVQRKVQHLRIV